MDTNQMPMKGMMIRRHLIKKIIFLFLAVIFFIVWFFGQQLWIGITAKGYQAVFLTNGQVYFGKLSASGGWLVLNDIYYLQATQPLQQTTPLDQTQNSASANGQTTNPQNIQLVKLGSELHGPTDTMYLERDKVLFWENMKDNSKVLASIKQYQSKQ